MATTAKKKVNRTIDKIITNVSTKFGAPRGRSNVNECPREFVNGVECFYHGHLFDAAVRLDNGGYDKGGVYWGVGRQLRVKYNKDLTYIEFYRLGEK